ncbi:DUF2442 domain-containing protein [Aquidulcibacter sp.]|jgi:hypothetical protein|uniref:DUF2442 domain-containing protein n=1 Tax=Aquidulcibacter sp. TaxID=2052990 RepID=UPI0037C0AACB
MRKLAKITRVETCGPHTLEIWFEDGSHGVWQADMTGRRGPMAQPLHDANFFARASIEDNALVWPNGWDASADFVQEEMRRAGTLKGKLAAAE